MKGIDVSEKSDIEIQDGVSVTPPLVFFKESAIFGDRRPNQSEWLKHEELYNAISNTIDPTHITGLQRVRGMWRIYIDNYEDKVDLMADGFVLRGKTMKVLKTNPLRYDGELTTRIRIKDIPLSVDDGVIERTLTLKTIECIGKVEREKLRINSKLTNCNTGDRFVIVKTSTLKEPLPKQMMFGHFKATVYHPGQSDPKTETICSKCFESGHRFKDCTNEFKCRHCKQTGHKMSDCPLNDDPSTNQGTAIAPANNQINPGTSNQSPKVTVVSQKSIKLKNASVQPAIDAFLNAAKNNTSTPNKGREQLAHQSPPTPLEKLNNGSKKHCSYHSDTSD